MFGFGLYRFNKTREIPSNPHTTPSFSNPIYSNGNIENIDSDGTIEFEEKDQNKNQNILYQDVYQETHSMSGEYLDVQPDEIGYASFSSTTSTEF